MKTAMEVPKTKVCPAEGMTDNINMWRSVRQGDALSTILFNVVAADMNKDIIQFVGYAYAMVIIARNRKNLEEAVKI